MRKQDRRGRSVSRAAVGLVAGVVLVPASAVSASADASKSGTKTCGGSSPYSYLQVQGKGTLGGKAPGKTSYIYRSFSSISTTTFEGNLYGGAWAATSNNILQDGGTYAWCSAAG